jgi:hypothetical protein
VAMPWYLAGCAKQRWERFAPLRGGETQARLAGDLSTRVRKPTLQCSERAFALNRTLELVFDPSHRKSHAEERMSKLLPLGGPYPCHVLLAPPKHFLLLQLLDNLLVAQAFLYPVNYYHMGFSLNIIHHHSPLFPSPEALFWPLVSSAIRQTPFIPQTVTIPSALNDTQLPPL